jgi:high-affinity iron transporter
MRRRRQQPGTSGRARPRLALAALIGAAAFALPAPLADAGQGGGSSSDTSGSEAPWRAAERVRASLFDAQAGLLLGEAAPGSVARARREFHRSLAPEIARSDPAALRVARGALDRAEAALRARDEVELAAARGRIVAAIREGSYAVTLDAVGHGELPTARSWILVRDFREATRFTRPGVDATAALDALAAGELAGPAARTQVKKDLLDAYQARLGDYLAEAEREAERGFRPALAESAALVRGYWLILEREYRRQGEATEHRIAAARFRELEDAALASDPARFSRAVDGVRDSLDGFTAAPFTAEEEARRAAQLTRFLDLVPIEYDDGTEDGRVTIPFELQEAVAFIDGAQAAFDDLEPVLDERDPEAAAAVEAAFDELRDYVVAANEGGEVVAVEQVEAAHADAAEILDSLFPEEWKQSSDEADFDLIEISLDQMEAAVSAGEPTQAEQARLSAYAFFEFGPEVKLRAFDPSSSPRSRASFGTAPAAPRDSRS